MTSLPPDLNRVSVLSYIASASVFGNLCLFVGAGFSKELVGAEALSWGDLLERAASGLGVEFDFKDNALIGTGYPEIASLLCRRMTSTQGVTNAQAIEKLKSKVAELTCWHPSDDKKTFYAGCLSALEPSWIITTNYDLVIESLLPGRAISIGPDQPLVFPKGRIPVYHLHGTRSYPGNLVLCREDYTALFRPNEYRQIKLALTLKESTTLLLGYGLGDDNVLTALDWSRNVFDKEAETYPSEVIQVVRCKAPEKLPYRGHNGAVIIEVVELNQFFMELQPFVLAAKKNQATLDKSLDNIRESLTQTPAEAVRKFIDEQPFREATLNIINSADNHRVIEGFIPFFDKCIDETFQRSSGYNAFAGYAEGLILVLDILNAYRDTHIPPALFLKIAHALYRQAPYVGLKKGQSHAAANTWDRRKSTLPSIHLAELRAYALSKEWGILTKLLNTAS